MMDTYLMLLQSMPPWAVGSLVTIGLFMAGHLGLAIWFAAGIKSQVMQLVGASQTTATELQALSKLDGRIQVIESRMNRAELDSREAEADKSLGGALQDIRNHQK